MYYSLPPVVSSRPKFKHLVACMLFLHLSTMIFANSFLIAASSYARRRRFVPPHQFAAMGFSRMTPSDDIDIIAGDEDSDELEATEDPPFSDKLEETEDPPCSEDEVEYSIIKGRWYRRKSRC